MANTGLDVDGMNETSTQLKCVQRKLNIAGIAIEIDAPLLF